MAGNFTTDNADNLASLPNGFYPKPQGTFPQGGWCNDLSGTVYPDASVAAASATLASYGRRGRQCGTEVIPSQFIDPGSAALAKIWPAANANPATTLNNVNYYQPIPNINNGWI